MAMPHEDHHQIMVETYSARKSGSKFEIRVRPVEGEIFPQDIMVQFSRKVRDGHPIGTRFRIWVKESDIEGGPPFLQSPWQWPYEVVG
jgi:hypothetical protein